MFDPEFLLVSGRVARVVSLNTSARVTFLM